MAQNGFIKALDDPESLEQLYRTQSTDFVAWLKEASDVYPDSETVRVWKARVEYEKPAVTQKSGRTVLFVTLVAIIAGSLVKLHELPGVDAAWYLPRFVPVIVIGSLIVYFLPQGISSKNRGSLVGVLMGVIILTILPDANGSASVTMSLIHIPFVFLSILALAFMAESWKSSESRISFVRYLGEVVIYASVILLGGMVLTFVTFALFGLIKVDIYEWYIEYVVVFGLVASPVVATYLYDVVLGRESRLATIIANIFAPLFLITVCAYLVAIIVQGKSPYSDRNFLIVINGLLLVVLAITVYSLSGKNVDEKRRHIDVVNICLVVVTLMINIYALSAILFRWAEYGMTPNRVAVTGANILIFGHLILILKEYLSHIRERLSPKRLTDAVACYLPLYSAWSLLMVVILPILFGFE